MRLLLLSGGLESTALAAWLRPTLTLTIDYGQRPAEGEIWAAGQVARELGLEHHVLRADCSAVGSGLLSGRAAADAAPVPEWWPYRNQLLVTLAAAWGIGHGVSELIVGSVAGDSRHADGTQGFYEQLARLVSAQEGGVVVRAPAIAMTSAELLERSDVADSVLGWTHSCHIAPVACGSCPGCTKRREVLGSLGRLG